jgi:hypothetical protein
MPDSVTSEANKKRGLKNSPSREATAERSPPSLSRLPLKVVASHGLRRAGAGCGLDFLFMVQLSVRSYSWSFTVVLQEIPDEVTRKIGFAVLDRDSLNRHSVEAGRTAGSSCVTNYGMTNHADPSHR